MNPEIQALGDHQWKKLTLAPRTMRRCAGGQLEPSDSAQTLPQSRVQNGVQYYRYNDKGYLWYFGGAHVTHSCNDVEVFDVERGQWQQRTFPEPTRVSVGVTASATANTITFATLNSTVSHNGSITPPMTVCRMSGSTCLEQRAVHSYNHSTRTVTLLSAWTTIPVPGVGYRVYQAPGVYGGGVEGGGYSTSLTATGKPLVEHYQDYAKFDPVHNRMVLLTHAGTMAYDVTNDTWSRLAPNTPSAGASVATSVLMHYDPDLAAAGNSGLQAMNGTGPPYANKKWVLLNDGTWRQRGGYPADLPGSGCQHRVVVSAYVPDLKRHFMQISSTGTGCGGPRFYLYDATLDSWGTQLKEIPAQIEGGAFGSLAYDEVNRRVLGIKHTSPVTAWIGDLTVTPTVWTKLSFGSQPVPSQGGSTLPSSVLRWDPVHGVFLFLQHSPGSSYTGSATQTWAYRYQKGSDTIAPTVAVTAPAAGTSVSGTVPLSATATDNVGIVRVEFRVDGLTVSVADTVAPYAASWPTDGTANGTHVITAVASDAAGNSATSAGVAVTLANPGSDSANVKVSIAAPATGAIVTGAVVVSATASAVAGVAGVQFKLDGANLAAEDTVSPYAVTWGITPSPAGTHSLTAVARDREGRVTVSAPVAVVLDKAMPTISVTSPSSGSRVRGVVTMRATAADDTRVTSVQFTRGAAALGPADTTAPYEIAWDTRAVKNGSYALQAVARDAANRTTTSASVTVIVDNKQVAASLALPAPPALAESVSNASATVVGPSDPWCRIINGAAPGSEILLAPGTYVAPCAITAVGAAAAPVVVRSQSEADGSWAVLAHTGPTGDTLTLSDAEWVVLRGLTFAPTRTGVHAIRIRRARDVVIEGNAFLAIGGTAVTATDEDTERITVRQNTFRDVAGTAMSFGCDDGAACHATGVLVEGNVIESNASPDAGHGLELKLNSYGTLRDNTILRTPGAGVAVHGSDRNDPPSVVERNYIEGARADGGVVVLGGPAIVRNNVLVENAGSGVSAQDPGGRDLQQNVWIVHNTIVDSASSGIAVQGWQAGRGNVIANNAIRLVSGTPALEPPTPDGTTGNITCAVADGCWQQAVTRPFDLWPALGGPLVDAGPTGADPWRPADDFEGAPRDGAPDAGAFERQ